MVARLEHVEATLPTVLVYRSTLLPFSETFIKEQMLAYRSWRGILAGRSLVHQLPLDGLTVHLIDAEASRFARRVRVRARLVLRRPMGTRDLLEENVRLVHAHFGPDALEAVPIARGLGVPLAVTLHGYDINIHRDWREAGYGGNSNAAIRAACWLSPASPSLFLPSQRPRLMQGAHILRMSPITPFARLAQAWPYPSRHTAHDGNAWRRAWGTSRGGRNASPD